MIALEYQHYPIEVSRIPRTWRVSNISDVSIDVQSGFPTGKHNKDGRGIPHIRPMNIDRNGMINLSDVKYVAPETKDLRLHCGDVLFNNTNSPDLIGKTAAITRSEEWAFSNHMTRLRFVDAVDFRFAAHQLHFLWMMRYFRHRCVNHVNQASISGTPLSQTVPFLIAPLNEQRRIVQKIEELFSKLDAGVAALERVKANLKRYRAAVLKAAVEGKLTAEWRAQHPDTEPASKLLDRILKERRRKWEEVQLAKYAAANKEPPKGWREKYKEPAGPETGGLSIPPPRWTCATVEQVSLFAKYGSSAKTGAAPSGVPVLRMGNIQDGRIDPSDLKYLPHDHSEFPELLLRPGDLLFNRTNSAELVGKSAVYAGSPDLCSYASYLIGVRMVEGCDPRFLCCFLNSVYGRSWIGSVVSQQVGQANVNGTKLQALTFPLPSAAEQREIVAEVERRLSIVDELEAQVAADLKRAGRLRQSILKRAFAGRLVPQDPTDEPAAKLLERIRSARNGIGAVTPTQRRRRRLGDEA
jgi:type I restriction enzyme, S subunit